MMKTSRYIYFPFLIAVILAACATGPTLTQEQILGLQEQADAFYVTAQGGRVAIPPVAGGG